MTEARRLALRLYQQRWRAKRKAQGSRKRAPRARKKRRPTAVLLRGTDKLGALRLQAQKLIRSRHDSLATADPNAFNRRVSAEWHRLLREAGIEVES